jgi:hypothetical protein
MSSQPPEHWQEALAAVTACKYQFGAGRALAFGVPSSKHFLISFNYEVQGQMHTGQLLSEKAMPQGQLFPIRFNPDQPSEHAHHGSTPLRGNALIAFGVAGSVILSLLWWLFLRGCA